MSEIIKNGLEALKIMKLAIPEIEDLILQMEIEYSEDKSRENGQIEYSNLGKQEKEKKPYKSFNEIVQESRTGFIYVSLIELINHTKIRVKKIEENISKRLQF